ncbi:MAG TPA: hypothetical protein VLX68_01615 [Chitinivibrionales bacterium]|nr:hypothetical protein [Chitinivibrionales bacterium]
MKLGVPGRPSGFAFGPGRHGAMPLRGALGGTALQRGLQSC